MIYVLLGILGFLCALILILIIHYRTRIEIMKADAEYYEKQRWSRLNHLDRVLKGSKQFKVAHKYVVELIKLDEDE